MRPAHSVNAALSAWDSSVSARMVADILGWVEVAFVVLASVVAQYLYIVLLLENTPQPEPYFLAGIVCALLFRHIQWKRGLNEVAILQQGALAIRAWLAIACISLPDRDCICFQAFRPGLAWLAHLLVYAGLRHAGHGPCT